MSTFYEAIEALSPNQINDTEEVYILETLNRVLAQDIISNIDFPAFNKATMDGFAYRFLDVGESLTLKVVDSIYAGDDKEPLLNKGECVRIMTGAKVPKSCNSVVEFEAVKQEDEYIKFNKPPKPNQNIAYKAEDLTKGELVLQKGTLIKPQMINLLAQLGFTQVKVLRKLNIGVITTGDELVDIGEHSTLGVVDTSRYSLISQIKYFNQNSIDYGKVNDDFDQITRVLQTACSTCDIVLITGGSSFGDKDFTAKSLQSINAIELIRTIDMKPGRPTIIAKKNNVWIIGVPGNPVSTFSVFRLFVGRLISKMLGCLDFDVAFKQCTINFDYSKKPGRIHFLPAIVEFKNGTYVANKLKYNGSGDFSALSKANAFLSIPKQIDKVFKGEKLEFFFI